MSENILALYDFASKQEYIYRTPKIREISGASSLMSGMYGRFVRTLNESGMHVNYDFDNPCDPAIPFRLESFSADAEVLYNGGGNLMMIYKDNETYLKANSIISAMLLEKVPTLSMIVCGVGVTGNFNYDKMMLYKKNVVNKNKHAAFDITSVTPFTQIDPMTFLPVTYKGKGKYYPEESSVSSDRIAKLESYLANRNKNTGKQIEDLDGSDENKFAVIYCDGNFMGNKLKHLRGENYEDGVRYLREFSRRTEDAYITKTFAAIDALNYKYRRVIGGGDEITIICEAKNALEIVKTYFDALDTTGCVIPDDCATEMTESEKKNTACAGIAVMHSKAPFTVAYEIAEAACEIAKEKAHKQDGNFFDFHYCHAGITADFETLRTREQGMTGRPYAVADIPATFERYKPVLNLAGRANVKALGNAAQLGDNEFEYETERVNAYINSKKKTKEYQNCPVKKLSAEDKELIYDMSEFYDLWFAKEDEEDEEND